MTTQQGNTMNFKEFLLGAPDLSALDLERAADEPRELDLVRFPLDTNVISPARNPQDNAGASCATSPLRPR